MAISLKQAIQKDVSKKKQLDSGVGKVKALRLEVNGLFKDNIGKDRITPKTKKPKGKTLYDKGLGQKSIVTIFKKGKLITGNSRFYMQYHLDDGSERTKMPVRNWLQKPKELDAILEAWIREFMRI